MPIKIDCKKPEGNPFFILFIIKVIMGQQRKDENEIKEYRESILKLEYGEILKKIEKDFKGLIVFKNSKRDSYKIYGTAK